MIRGANFRLRKHCGTQDAILPTAKIEGAMALLVALIIFSRMKLYDFCNFLMNSRARIVMQNLSSRILHKFFARSVDTDTHVPLGQISVAARIIFSCRPRKLHAKKQPV